MTKQTNRQTEQKIRLVGVQLHVRMKYLPPANTRGGRQGERKLGWSVDNASRSADKTWCDASARDVFIEMNAILLKVIARRRRIIENI